VDYPKVLQAVSSILEESGARFAVAGGWAMNSYGRGRATFDLDLVVPQTMQDLLVERLEAMGYETLHRSPGYSNHLHADAAWGRLDLIYVRGETAQRLFDGAVVREVFPGMTAAVPKPEHLAAMKVTAIKNDPSRKLEDLADIRALLHLPEIDRDEVRGYFERAGLRREYEEAVDRI
jgi:hypothetical protein